MDRKTVLSELVILESQCAGCLLPPYPKGLTEKRREWCKANCNVPFKIQAIGDQLDEIAQIEAAERAYQKRIQLKKQKSLDVGASRLVAL